MMDNKQKKLYRSTEDKMLAGVAGGVAEYFDIDSTLVRILFAGVAIFSLVGIFAYPILALIIPKRPDIGM